MLALAVVAIACLPSAATAKPPPGKTTSGTVTSNDAEFPYLLYTPKSYRPRKPMPLVVMVHGCQTTAEQELKVTRFNTLAEHKGFVVLYPDVDEIGKNQPGPLANCWKFVDPTAYIGRDSGDTAAIAAMTQAIKEKRSINAQRVYLVGISAGGLMSSVLASTYADLYAAVVLMSTAGFADGPCFTTGVGIPAEASAQLAYTMMGEYARVVPRMVLGGDADLAFPWYCTNKALEQGLRTNNLVLGSSQTAPISLEPAAVQERQKPGGYDYTVSRYRDPDGCLIGESWRIHTMGHYWSGGSRDPSVAGYGDTRGPSGAQASWRFLRRYRLAGTSMPCAETRARGRAPQRFHR